jgi:CheY-like chemotaxis protein
MHPIHRAGQTDRSVYGRNETHPLIRSDENRNAIILKSVERVWRREGTVMRRILIVDDDPHICLAIRAWLKRYGFRVTIADGGSNGISALDNSTFDLMIVDIFMPNMRGFESIRVFHNHAPKVPLIAISGYAFAASETSGSDFLRMAMRLGATRCLRKPFRPTTLLSVIDQCLSETEPHRRYVTTLAAVSSALSEPQGKMSREGAATG